MDCASRGLATRHSRSAVPCRPTNEDDLPDVLLMQLRVAESTQPRRGALLHRDTEAVLTCRSAAGADTDEVLPCPARAYRMATRHSEKRESSTH